MDVGNIPRYVHDPDQDKSSKSRNSPLVSHVILAEFDILKGPSLTCQYPSDIGADPLCV